MERVIYREIVQDPWVSESTVRGDLFTRQYNHKKVHLHSRRPGDYPDGEKRQLLEEGLELLRDLKHHSKQLGFLVLDLKATPYKSNGRRYGRAGNPEFLSLDGDRKSNIDHTKLKRICEDEAFYMNPRDEERRNMVQVEAKENNNCKLQSFLIYNYGERVEMVEPVEHGRVSYLRRHGLSMKEIELLFYLWWREDELQEHIADIFPYIDEKDWEDIRRVMYEFMEHDDRQERKRLFRKYLDEFVTHTFVTQMQEFEENKEFDFIEMYAIKIDEELVIPNEDANETGEERNVRPRMN